MEDDLETCADGFSWWMLLGVAMKCHRVGTIPTTLSLEFPDVCKIQDYVEQHQATHRRAIVLVCIRTPQSKKATKRHKSKGIAWLAGWFLCWMLVKGYASPLVTYPVISPHLDSYLSKTVPWKIWADKPAMCRTNIKFFVANASQYL